MREGKSWSGRWDEARGVSDESQGVEDGGGAAASELLAIYGSPFWPTPPHPPPPLPSASPLPLLSLAGLSSLEAIFLFLARLYQITINIAVATCSPPPLPPHRRIGYVAGKDLTSEEKSTLGRRKRRSPVGWADIRRVQEMMRQTVHRLN